MGTSQMRHTGSEAVLMAADATGYFYLKTTVDSGRFGSTTVGPQNVNDLPVLVPQVSVRFTVRTGDDFSFDDSGYNSGAVIGLITPDSAGH